MSVRLFDDHAEIVVEQVAHQSVQKLAQKWTEVEDWFFSRFQSQLNRLANPDAEEEEQEENEDDESLSVLEISLDETCQPSQDKKDISITSNGSQKGSQRAKSQNAVEATVTPKRSARLQEKRRTSMNAMNETKFMTPEAKIPFHGRASPVSTSSMRSLATSSLSSSSKQSQVWMANGAAIGSSRPSKLKAPLSSNRSQRHIPRLIKPSAASGSAIKPAFSSAKKNLTASALQKKQEIEAERVALIQQQMREKEEKALQQKQQFLENKVLEHKTKREEKERKVAMTREQLEKEAAERRQRESAKKMAKEKKLRELEEVRRLMQKRAEEKELMEKKAAEEAQKKLEEEERIKREQMEVSEIRNKIVQLQQNKMSTSKMSSSFLQHKAMTNSFMVKQQQQPVTQSATTVHQSLMSEMNDTSPEQVVKEPVAANGQSTEHNSTFVKEKTDLVKPAAPASTTKPPLTSYDITDLNSDAESDDERKPRKAVPDWARGNAFLEALNGQFAKQKKHREKEILKIFRLCPTTVDLTDIFKNYSRAVVPRYEKRTSSACWSSPPANKLLNMSSSFWANASFAPSLDTSICH